MHCFGFFSGINNPHSDITSFLYSTEESYHCMSYLYLTLRPAVIRIHEFIKQCRSQVRMSFRLLAPYVLVMLTLEIYCFMTN